MKSLFRRLVTLGIAVTVSLLLATPQEFAAMQSTTNVFWSGHSLTAPPIPEMLTEISASFGIPMDWNSHSMAGASLEARTRGRPPNMSGWDGYRQGNNRAGTDMDVIDELRSAATVGGNGYDRLIITEVHGFLWSLLRGDSVRLLRHYHEQFQAANPAGQTFFYQSWLDIDKQDPQPWIDYERAAEPLWQCISTRINKSLMAESRSDRLRFLPASLSLVTLVEAATNPDMGVPGITGSTNSETLGHIFRDNVHLTDTGSYYIALVSYAFLEEKSPQGAWAPKQISEATALSLQILAWDFFVNYQRSNTPLTLPECSAKIRNGFAEHYWRFETARELTFNIPWYKKALKRLTAPARIYRNTSEWRAGFADDNPENPLRFDAERDADYWHPSPSAQD